MEGEQENQFTHISEDGMPQMVDIGGKQNSRRSAVATGKIRLPAALQLEMSGNEIITKKGAVIQTAIVVGTQAVKRTADIIPFCHQLPLEAIKFTHTITADRTIEMSCEVSALYKTGVEMEALTGVTVALLTIYDMCKSAGQDMDMEDIRIVRKKGGKSDIDRVVE
jgi:cyclic pyranopterin monophosphate synthase